MTPYMGCVGAGSIVVSPPCVNLGPTVASKVPSPFYPGFVVGDTAAARYVFLGADQPSYHAHIIRLRLSTISECKGKSSRPDNAEELGVPDM